MGRALETYEEVTHNKQLVADTHMGAKAGAKSTVNEKSASAAVGGALFKMVLTLVNILETKDPFMEYHSEKVTRIAAAIGAELGLSKTELIQLQMGALFHDIGNLGVRDSVLQKAGHLTPEEHDHMMSHTEIGVSLLGELFEDQAILDVIKYHHERWDGRGRYGKKGSQIPLYARIVAVADSFDAMTSARPYRPAKSQEEAVLELRKMSGSQFDPAVVKAFLICRDEGVTEMLGD